MSPRTSRHAHRAVALGIVALVACLDPLFEDLSAADERAYAVCCKAGRITTCPCPSKERCTYALRACAEGSCTSADAGAPLPSCSGGGAADAGVLDAGVPSDGGAGAVYVPYCDAAVGEVGTLQCGPSLCEPPPFHPCADGRCAPAGTDGCPNS